MNIINWVKKFPDHFLILLGGFLIVWHIYTNPQQLNQLLPVDIHNFNLNMSFVVDKDEVEVKTYIPQQSERQKILAQNVQSGNLAFHINSTPNGLLAIWETNNIFGLNKINYHTQVVLQKTQFQLPRNIQLPDQYPEHFQQYLIPTNDVQSNHFEIKDQLAALLISSKNTFDKITTVYDFVRDELEDIPFKGRTDALTALRLKQASCNGKGRLFIAMMRNQGIPARLIGGVILNDGVKKTSHQWTELYLNTHWVPFDPTNGHFASIPDNYLQLYRGDKALFTHSSNIDFEYLFDISTQKMSPATHPGLLEPGDFKVFNASMILGNMGLSPTTASIFLLFPFCALIITFCRNVIGIKSFGVFMPMLVAAACIFTGFWLGIVAFAIIVFIAFSMHLFLDRYRILKIPRLAAVITLITIMILTIVFLMEGTEYGDKMGIIAVFPVVIIAFTAERLHNLVEEEDWINIILMIIGSLILILFCYLAFESVLLRGLFAIYPELFLWVLAAQISVGCWSGIRVSEYLRFKNIIARDSGNILSINSRNRDYIYASNSTELILLANDKLKSKNILKQHQIPVPESIAEFRQITDLQMLDKQLGDRTEFVIKPNAGSQGRGIMIIREKDEQGYRDVSGKHYSLKDISLHIREILSGSFSMNGDSDIAYIEPLIHQHQFLEQICNLGLCDIRVIVYRHQVVVAMLRMPTEKSNGKANLHQGAIGIAIDIETGKTSAAKLKSKSITHHPDTGAELIGLSIPFWESILDIALASQQAIPLGYIGIDIALDQHLGPLVLEVNARPGLEIQNIQSRGVKNKLIFIEQEFS